MPNTFEYEEQIESEVIQALQAGTSYTIDRFYATYSPAALYDEVKAKMSAINGTALVHWQETQYDPIDTTGRMLQSSPRIEILCAWPSASNSQLTNQPRKVLEIATAVVSVLMDLQVTLDGDNYDFDLKRKQNLFRDTNMDAVLVTMAIDAVITEF